MFGSRAGAGCPRCGCVARSGSAVATRDFHEPAADESPSVLREGMMGKALGLVDRDKLGRACDHVGSVVLIKLGSHGQRLTLGSSMPSDDMAGLVAETPILSSC